MRAIIIMASTRTVDSKMVHREARAEHPRESDVTRADTKAADIEVSREAARALGKNAAGGIKSSHVLGKMPVLKESELEARSRSFKKLLKRLSGGNGAKDKKELKRFVKTTEYIAKNISKVSKDVLETYSKCCPGIIDFFVKEAVRRNKPKALAQLYLTRKLNTKPEKGIPNLAELLERGLDE